MKSSSKTVQEKSPANIFGLPTKVILSASRWGCPYESWERSLIIVVIKNFIILICMRSNSMKKKKIDWFPGWPLRRQLLNDGLRNLADKYDNVEFFPIVDLMMQFEANTPADLWRDGIHFSPQFHRAIGEKLADHVEKWASSQPHLAQP